MQDKLLSPKTHRLLAILLSFWKGDKLYNGIGQGCRNFGRGFAVVAKCCAVFPAQNFPGETVDIYDKIQLGYSTPILGFVPGTSRVQNKFLCLHL